MKSPIHLLQLIVTECGNRCRISTVRDIKTISERFDTEGYSFLAITLAKFGKQFQKGLSQGFVSPAMFPSFRARGSLPVFLRGFLENVFEPDSGVLHSTPCVECIRSIRQICLMWAKLKAPASPKRERAAFNKYMECESSVQINSVRLTRSERDRGDEYGDFRRLSQLLFAPSFSVVDLAIYEGKLVPRHGPGAVAERLTSNGKFSSTLWNDRLERIFPSGRYQFSSYSFFLESGVTHLDPGSEIPTRVISVPKTVDTPRIIGIEPTAMQYMQQALKREFEELWEMPSLHGRVNFPHHFIRYMDQVPNQNLARIGSSIGSLATLDLSEASDRVSNRLVKWLFQAHPHLSMGVQACRSRRADLPGHGVIPLAKFASMGSALTFPVESMVFLTVIFIGIERALGTPLTVKLIKSFIGHVRVYGDDIIVPVEFAIPVIEALELYGFKVNRDKSFWSGKFRESCGKDYYDGEDVSLVRLRQPIPYNRKQAEHLVSFAEFRNQLYLAGYWTTVKEIDRWIKDIIPFPAAAPGAQGITKVSFLGYTAERFDSKLQRPLVRAFVPVYIKRSDTLDGHGALMKFFLNKQVSERPIRSEDHLQFAGRPSAVDIKQRWVHPDYGMPMSV